MMDDAREKIDQFLGSLEIVAFRRHVEKAGPGVLREVQRIELRAQARIEAMPDDHVNRLAVALEHFSRRFGTALADALHQLLEFIRGAGHTIFHPPIPAVSPPIRRRSGKEWIIARR